MNKDKNLFTAYDNLKINKKIGLSLKKINEFKKAIEYFTKAIQVEGEPPKNEEALCYSLLASCYLSDHMFTEAIFNFKESEALFENLNDMEELSRVTFYLGVSHLRNKNHEKSIEYFDKSYEIRHNLEIKGHETGLILNQKGIAF